MIYYIDIDRLTDAYHAIDRPFEHIGRDRIEAFALELLAAARKMGA